MRKSIWVIEIENAKRDEKSVQAISGKSVKVDWVNNSVIVDGIRRVFHPNNKIVSIRKVIA